MVYFPDSYLDDLIREDAPYGDETSTLLGIEDQPGMVVGAPKVTGVVSGVSVAAKLCRRVGLKATEHVKDGDRVEAGTPVLTLEGTASQLHLVYKTAQRLMETCSGIAGRTRQMVDAAQSVNPNCQVALTRKHFPGAKLLLALRDSDWAAVSSTARGSRNRSSFLISIGCFYRIPLRPCTTRN